MCYNIKAFAGVVKLADTLDLGSSASRVQVQVLSPAPMEQTTSDVRFEVFFMSVCVMIHLVTILIKNCALHTYHWDNISSFLYASASCNTSD